MTTQERNNLTQALELVYDASNPFSNNKFSKALVDEAKAMIAQIRSKYGHLVPDFGQDDDIMLGKAVEFFDEIAQQKVKDLANSLYENLNGEEPIGVLKFREEVKRDC